MDELVRRFLTNAADARPVIADDKATYFGTPVDDRSLTPGGAKPLLGPTHFDGWLSQSQTARA
jgi:hypothetical protein